MFHCIFRTVLKNQEKCKNRCKWTAKAQDSTSKTEMRASSLTTNSMDLSLQCQTFGVGWVSSSKSSCSTLKAEQLEMGTSPGCNFGAFTPLNTDITKPSSTVIFLVGVWNKTTLPALSKKEEREWHTIAQVVESKTDELWTSLTKQLYMSDRFWKYFHDFPCTSMYLIVFVYTLFPLRSHHLHSFAFISLHSPLCLLMFYPFCRHIGKNYHFTEIDGITKFLMESPVICQHNLDIPACPQLPSCTSLSGSACWICKSFWATLTNSLQRSNLLALVL